ncbi:MAG: hemolysin XhlA family protein [Peptostreptococcaceae bacterium]
MNEEVKEHMIENHDKRLNNHGDRLDKLEQQQCEFKVQIQNLVKSIEGLTTSIKWALGLFAGSFVGFFFYAVQNHLFK